VRCGKKKRVSHSLLRSVAGPPSTATRKRRHQAFRHDTDREMPYKIPISVSVQRPAQTCRPCDLSPLATRWSLAQCGAVSCQRGELGHPRLRMSSRPAVRRVLDETDILIHDDLHVHSLRPASYVGRQRNSRFLHFERAKRPSCFFF